MQKRVALSLVLTLLVIVASGAYMGLEPQRQAAAAQRQRQEAVNRGMPLFAGYCSLCHGTRGEGKVGPSLAAGGFLERHDLQGGDASSLHTAQILMQKTIARGVPKTVMPPWAVEEGGALNQEQILEIASFLLYAEEADWRKAASLASAPAAAPQAASPPAGTDLASRGRQVYEAKGCIACHGPQGQGGLGPALGGFNEAQIAKQVRTPRGTMPAYPPDRLSDEEVKALAAFVESLTKK